MPIEIKELVIRAIIQDPDATPSTNLGPDANTQDAIVHACVTQVLRILKTKEDR
jgi:hypothetical protein